VELNFGCPHPAMMPGVHGGSMIGQEPEVAAEVVRQVCDAVKIPVMVKLTPDQARLLEVARSVREAGARAVTATNRYTGFAIDIETGMPRIGGPAGIGGTWTKPLSLRWVHRISQELGMPVSGSNGIFDHRDVVEFIMAGAGIVQVGSILMLKGIKWLPNIIKGLDRFMDDHGYIGIEAMRGIASRQAARDYSAQFARARSHVEIDAEKCENPTCTVCIQMCFYEALSQSDGCVQVHADNCIGCELCYDVCPFHAMAMQPNAAPDVAGEFFHIPDEVFEVGKFTTARNNPDSIGKPHLKKTA
jgi:dihydropyrimidine dehydrogenase (NAD+) subunit PreA